MPLSPPLPLDLHPPGRGHPRVEEGIAEPTRPPPRDRRPLPEELAGATYTGIEDQGPVTLSAGKWEGQPLIEGGASVPALWLSEGFHLTGDLDQDGADEAVVHLTYSSGGTGNFGYLAVMGREGGEVVQEAIGLVGDRVQIRGARIDGGSVVLDVLQAGPDDGMCCPRQLATRTFGIQSGKLVETDVTGDRDRLTFNA